MSIEQSPYNVYNFVTEEFQQGIPETDEEAMQCIPQTERELYDLYRHIGHSVFDAWGKVLQAIVNVHEELKQEQ